MVGHFLVPAAAVVLVSSCNSPAIKGSEQTCTLEVRAVVGSECCTADSVFIAGNHKNLGNWQPDAVKMDRLGDSLFVFRTELPMGFRAEFKITAGSWDREAVYQEGLVPGNTAVRMDSPVSLTLKVLKWKEDSGGGKHRSGVTGHVEVHRISYPGKEKRRVQILLPPDYDADSTIHYPVLYMHDGQNCFDPAASFSGADWRADEVSDSLIRAGELSPFIIAAVDNSEERMTEYTWTEDGREYIDWLVGTLKPFIDEQYRTLPDAENTAVMGSSLGADISLLAAGWKPEVFGAAAALSAALYKNDARSVNRLIKKRLENGSSRIYLDTGNELERSGYVRKFQRTETVLMSLNDSGERVMVRTFPGQDHNEAAWARRIHVPLLFLFPLSEDEK